MQLGRFQTNNIYNEDSYSAIKDIPDNSIDLIVVDPPYLIESTTTSSKSKLSQSIQAVSQELKKNNITNGVAEFLGRINPYWNTKMWKLMMDEHLKMTEEEAVQVLNGEYKQSIASFDSIYDQALRMADEMSMGIAKQFRIVN